MRRFRLPILTLICIGLGACAVDHAPIQVGGGEPIPNGEHPTAYRYTFEYSWAGTDLERLKSVSIETAASVVVNPTALVDEAQVNYRIDVPPTANHDDLAAQYNDSLLQSASLSSNEAKIILPADTANAKLHDITIELPANSTVQIIVNGHLRPAK